MANGADTRVERYARWVIKWRWAIVVGTLIFVGLVGSGGQHLAFRNDYKVYFGEENPQLRDFEAMQKIYTQPDNILFVLEPPDGDVFTPTNLDAVEYMSTAV